MSHRSRIAGLLSVVMLLAAALPASAAPPDPTRAADAGAYGGRLIVLWRGVAPAALGIPGVQRLEASARPLRSVVTARAGAVADVAATLRRDPRVLAVVPDARLEAADWPADAPPDDPRYPAQGNLPQVGVPEAWTVTTGDPGVVVAVLDSGVDLGHPDLDDVDIADPRNVTWNSDDVTDALGHGTFVAGTILAETDNGVGIAGIAPDVTLMPVKVMDDEGGVSLADMLDGVDWAREHGADVISMSFGGLLSPAQAALCQPTFTAARDAGILVVAASGNEGVPLRNYPAAFRGVVSVGAVDAEDEIAAFATTGRTVDLVAPGVDLWGPVPGGGYEQGDGTSFAAPHVAAAAALVWSARPALAVEELEAVLRGSAVDLGAAGRDPVYADGRLDVAAALDEPVPDPIPDLDPPAAQPALTMDFLAPAAPVTQVGSRYTVRIATNHETVLGGALLLSWRIDAGRCPTARDPSLTLLDFAPVIELRGLVQGRCYRVDAGAMDEDGSIAEASSPIIRVVDPILPRVVRRSPAPGATGVDRGANVRVTFSEPVLAPAGTVRLRNLATGLVVRTATRWVASTNTLVLDPVLRMYPRTTYRVEIGAGVQDRTGNPVGARTWTFRTGR